MLESVASVLARVGLRDDRILDLLLAQLRRAPAFAGNLAEYGDPRALPSLLEALDAFELNESGNPFANHALIEIRCAIEELGGTLTAEQQLKCRCGQAAAEFVRRELLEEVSSRCRCKRCVGRQSLPLIRSVRARTSALRNQADLRHIQGDPGAHEPTYHADLHGCEHRGPQGGSATLPSSRKASRRG
jgi:hypothetical protein